MSVQPWHIWNIGSASMPDDDSVQNIGGAADKSLKMSFAPIELSTAVTVVAVSSAAGDTTQTIQVYGRDTAGVKEDTGSELALNGTTPVTSTQTLERFMKATKSAACAGDIAIYPTGAAVHGDTAQAGAANEITLASGASASDNAYQFMVLRITSGTGVNQIREILSYNGTTKKAYVRDWDTTPDDTSVYEIRKGMVMEQVGPDSTEIDEVRRIAYDAAANPGGGAEKKYYEKGFSYNDHATLALTNAKVDEVDLGGYAKVAFALETTLDGTGTNGAGNNRLVAPSTGIGSFDSDQKDVANSGALSPGSGQGIWFEVTLDGGDAADDTYYQTEVTGQSV